MYGARKRLNAPLESAAQVKAVKKAQLKYNSEATPSENKKVEQLNLDPDFKMVFVKNFAFT